MNYVEFFPEAREEFMAEVTYYEAIRRGLGSKFASSVEKATSLIAAFPQAGSLYASGTRRVVIKDFPFWLIYKAASNNRIIIFALAHQARRPDYWLHRVS